MVQPNDQLHAVRALLDHSLPPGTAPALIELVIPNLLAAISSISGALQGNTAHALDTQNDFGDTQLNLDVLSEDLLRAQIKSCPHIVAASSEEDPVERSSDSSAQEDQTYTIAFDPLDGSSIIGANWTVGTIIGIWTGSTALNRDPADQVAAILGVYGPRTTAIVALRLPDSKDICFELALTAQGWTVAQPQITLAFPPFKTRYFAPANLRAAAEDERYMSLVTELIREKATLRYSGGLVPDVLHALVKGHGLYLSPVTAGSKAKLRRLYELAPVALVVECAGGKAVDATTGRRILERAIKDCDERGGIICGTAEEVDRAVGHFGLL